MVNEIEPHTRSTLKIINAFILKTTGKTIAQYRKEAAAIDARIKKDEARLKVIEAKKQLKRAEARVKQAEKRYEILCWKTEPEIERIKTETKRIKAETKHINAKRVKAEAETIFNCYSKAGLSIETIASTLNIELEYVKKIIDARLTKE